MTSVTDDLPLAADFPKATDADWRKLVDGVLKGAPFEKLVGKTYDGLRIEPLYPRAKGAAPVPDARRPRHGRSCSGSIIPMRRRRMRRRCMIWRTARRDSRWCSPAATAPRLRPGTDGRNAVAKCLKDIHLDAGIGIELQVGPQIADGRDPCRGICEAQRHRSRRLRHPLRARSARGLRGVGLAALIAGRRSFRGHRWHQGPCSRSASRDRSRSPTDA